MIGAIVLTITFHGKHSPVSTLEETPSCSGVGTGEASGEPGPVPTQESDERGQ
jgi:hypothetical protein